MSFYQQISVNSVLDALKDEMLNNTVIQKEESSSEMDNEESQRETSEKCDEENEDGAIMAVPIGKGVITDSRVNVSP